MNWQNGLDYKFTVLKLLVKEIKSRQKNMFYAYEPASEKHKDFHLCGKKIRILTGAPRSGKTTAAIMDACLIMFGEHPVYKIETPNIGWVVVPKFHKVHETGGMLDKWRDILPMHRIARIIEDNKLNLYEIHAKNGSKVVFKSQEQGVDSFTSNSVHWIMPDERIDNHDIRIQLRARVIDQNGLLIYTMDKLEDDEWVDELKGKDYVGVYQFELKDNAKYLPKEEIERLEHELDEIDKERIFYGKYADRDSRPVFPKVVFNQTNYARKDPKRYDLINGEWIDNDAGCLRVFCEKRDNVQYILGFDVAEGVGNNAHAIQVFDEFGEQTAMWLNNTMDYNRLDTDVLAPLGHFYNDALIVGELRSYGYAVIASLMKMPYPNLYVDIVNRNLKQYKKTNRMRYGIMTDEVNKSEMVQKTFADIKESVLLLHDEKTYAQLTGFKEWAVVSKHGKGNIKYKGTRVKGDAELKNSDDDLVMALMFTDRAANAWGYFKPRAKENMTIDDIQDKRKILRQPELDGWYAY